MCHELPGADAAIAARRAYWIASSACARSVMVRPNAYAVSQQKADPIRQGVGVGVAGVVTVELPRCFEPTSTPIATSVATIAAPGMNCCVAKLGPWKPGNAPPPAKYTAAKRELFIIVRLYPERFVRFSCLCAERTGKLTPRFSILPVAFPARAGAARDTQPIVVSRGATSAARWHRSTAPGR
jgi:hypothetical protein